MPLLHHLAQRRLRPPNVPFNCRWPSYGQPQHGHHRHRVPHRRHSHAIWLSDKKRSVTLVLHKCIKEHCFLKAVLVEQGKSSVALLIMGSGSWETIPFPSGVSDLVPVHVHQGPQGCRVVDTELSACALTCRMMRMQLIVCHTAASHAGRCASTQWLASPF